MTDGMPDDRSAQLVSTNQPTASSNFKIAALFKFAEIADTQVFQHDLMTMCNKYEVLGMLFIATEGINGTIAASLSQMDAFLQAFFEYDPRFRDLELKFSYYEENPFYRMRISIRKEIVTMGVEDFRLAPSPHIHNLSPQQWNEVIARDDVVVIDTRNDYEYYLGTFENAVNPNTVTFREFPHYVKQTLPSLGKKKVAMFCTGGIRCEKACSYVLQNSDVDEVYNLQGGILKYLETMPQDNSKWNGECFVFDQRVTVGHGLEVGRCRLCRGCRHPLTVEEFTDHPLYSEGVHCKYCYDKMTPAKLERAKQRDLQIKLAQERHEKHLGYKHPGHSASASQAKRTRLDDTDADHSHQEEVSSSTASVY